MSSSPKRVFAIVGVIIMSGLGVWLAYRYKVSTEDTYVASAASSSPLVMISDPTGQNFKDWQKVLAESVSASGTVNEKLTNSDKFSRALFAQYAAIKNQNGQLTPQTENQIITSLLAQAQTALEKPTQYKASSLHVISSPSQADIAQYSATMHSILLAPRDPAIGNELSLLGEAVESRDASNLSEADTISKYYNTTANALLKVRIPAPIVDSHLAIINLYLKLAKNVTAFKYALSDPFTASINLNDYVKNSQAFSTSFSAIVQYLQNHNAPLQ